MTVSASDENFVRRNFMSDETSCPTKNYVQNKNFKANQKIDQQYNFKGTQITGYKIKPFEMRDKIRYINGFPLRIEKLNILNFCALYFLSLPKRM